MVAILINEDNADLFLPALDMETLVNSDIFIGAVDEESDTACGLLAAQAVEGHALSIRYIYVDEAFRRKGAGREMIYLLQDFASESDVTSIMCYRNIFSNDDDIALLLESCGFIRDMAAQSDLYSISPADMKEVKDIKFDGSLKKVRDVSYEEWKKLEKAYDEAVPEGDYVFDGRYYAGGLDPDISYIAYDEEGQPCGFLFAASYGDGIMFDTLKYTGKEGIKAGYALLKEALGQMKKILSPDDKISVSAVTNTELELMHGFCGDGLKKSGEGVLMVCDISL